MKNVFFLCLSAYHIPWSSSSFGLCTVFHFARGWLSVKALCSILDRDVNKASKVKATKPRSRSPRQGQGH